MDSRLFSPRYLLILVCFILSCNSENEGNTSSPGMEEKSTAAVLFEQAKTMEGAREKISYTNRALKVIHPQDSLLPILLDYKVYYHNSLKEYDSSLYFADSLRNVAIRLNDTSSLALAYYRKAKIYSYQGVHEEVFRNAYESRRLYLATGDSSKAGRRTLEMALAQLNSGDYTGGQESATEALRYLNPIKDSAYISNAYNNIAISYRNRKFFKDAIPEYQNALRFSKTKGDSISYLNNLALVYRQLHDYGKTISLLEELLQRVDKTNFSTTARIMDNLAFTRWMKDPTAPVEEDLLEAMRIRELNNDRDGLLASYDHLAEFYLQNDPAKARSYAEKLLNTARSYGSTDSELQALEHLVNLSRGEASRTYAREYIHLNDSITTVNLRAQNAFAKIRFDEERKQQEIFSLEAQNALQALEAQQLRTRSLVYIFVSLLLILGLFFIMYYLRQRHKKEKVKEVYKTESRISKVIHDELANDIFNVMSTLETVAPSPVIDKLESIYMRTRDISRENSEIDTGENFVDNLVAMLSNNTPAASRLILKGETSINWERIEEEKKIVIYRVLQELMINMKKHSGAGLVAIIFTEGNKELELNYSDNGGGVDWNSLKKRGGLQNLENRISSVNGKVNFESAIGKGFKASLKIPV